MRENEQAMEANTALERELAELKNEYQTLRDRKVRVEQDLANLVQQLEELEAGAEQAYGTSDPAELEKLLAEKQAENERLVSEYRSHINEIQKGLEQVEGGMAEEEGQ